MAELVDDLERFGYLNRRPDSADGRAKLIRLTDQGWKAITAGRRIIEHIENDWKTAIGQERYEALRATMQDLLDQLDPRVTQQYASPSGEAGDTPTQ